MNREHHMFDTSHLKFGVSCVMAQYVVSYHKYTLYTVFLKRMYPAIVGCNILYMCMAFNNTFNWVV